MIGRLDPQKGFDLLADAAPTLLERGARLVVQGSGHPNLADPFRAIAIEHPRQVAFIERFDRQMARRIYAGADFFAMPSRFEPCGQGQMIALRYGTPPIVHRTGGLADTVVDETTHPGAGTGFAFKGATMVGLLDACAAAMRLRAAGGPGWDALLDRGMSSAAGSEMSASPASQSPFSTRTDRAAAPSSWTSASALASTSAAGQAGFATVRAATAVAVSG